MCLCRLLAWVGCPLAIATFVSHFFGHISALLFLGQAAFAWIFLETMSYISHYGLTRKKMENGRYV